MEYKIKTALGQTFFLNNKIELFDFFDYLRERRKSISSACGDNFNIHKDVGAMIVGWETVVYEHYTAESPIYVENIYIIEDRHRFIVDYVKLEKEYNQSRGIKPYTRRQWVTGTGTRAYRKPLRSKMYKEAQRSGKPEFAQLLADKREGVKVRAKRFCDLKWQHVKLYDDELYRNDGVKSWKDKKIKKQWMKHLKK